MTGQDHPGDTAAELRARAEATYRQRTGWTPEELTAIPPDEARRTLHELLVHQIELEIQNEELRRAHAELDAVRARYFDLYDLAPVSYVTVSETGLILEANLTAAARLGVPRSDLVRQPLSRFIDKGDQDTYYVRRKALVDTGKPQAYELRMVTPDGGTFWVWLSTTAVQTADGAPVCRITMSDITERKRGEAERDKLQAQLNQAQKMESVGRLAGGVAHDFNNRLSVILGYTELALDGVAPDQPLYNYLSEVRKAAEHSADLTRQLLAFARKQTVAPRVLDLDATVEGMLVMLRRLIGENIELVWHPGRNLASVNMDPVQIDQILANLCVNARDAIADTGRITIETHLAAFDEDDCARRPGFLPGDYVVLGVSDDGCGMDAETLANCFEPLFTTKEFGKGTGLGLATVYGIVRQNQGFIQVASVPGRGTTFNVYLPRHVAPSPLLAAPAPSPPVAGGRETILLVEDEPAILKMTTLMLKQLGYAVLAASTPGEAIRLARQHAGQIELLMTDVVMPEMNGRDLAKNLLALYPDIRRLFMSGYTADVIAHHGVLDAGVHFIQKPFSQKDLATKLREALG